MMLCAMGAQAQVAQNRPYVDDKLFHFGFQLGINFASFGVTDSEIPQTNPITGVTEIYHARVSSILPGFHVGFVTDLRLCSYLNLRFCPGLAFSQRTLSYISESGTPVRSKSGQFRDKIDVLSIPITIPLYLKFTAMREMNYRPYIIAGGGFEYNVYRDAEQPVLLKGPDYFVEVGVGCDIYFRWFKFCPQISYKIGFANILTPADQNNFLTPDNRFYSTALTKLTSRMLCITFNFE
jgi:hypothetical protein